jgi:hypothetical protein
VPASRNRGEAGKRRLLNDLQHFPGARGEARPYSTRRSLSSSARIAVSRVNIVPVLMTAARDQE